MMPSTETLETTNGVADPDAPYGRTVSGIPKKRPGGRPPGSGAKTPRGKTATPPAKTPPRAKPAAGKVDYRPGLYGAAAILAVPLGIFSPLDGAAWHVCTDDIVEAVNTTAQERAEIAVWCERANKVGPYGLIIAALMKFGSQVLVNHDMIPLKSGARFGAVSREELGAQLVSVVERQEAAMAAAEQATAAAEPAPPEQRFTDVPFPQMSHVG